MEVSAEARVPEEDEIATEELNGGSSVEEENKFQKAIASWKGT